MVRTCHKCKGDSERYNEAELKRCAGCQKVFYCSAECQKDDWVCHIFNCKPSRPINTADYLALACHEKLLPDNYQTSEDYGFNRVSFLEDKSHLLGLYIGLIQRMKISPKTIHRWQVSGVLFQEIKAVYLKDPERSKGGSFPWFLRNEHLFTGEPMSEEKVREDTNVMLLRAWRFIGGSEKDSGAEVRVAIKRMSNRERACFMMYAQTLADWCPSPEFGEWVEFGFASCTSPREQIELGLKYQELIHKCTFKEFYDAYLNGGLLGLFRSKEVPLRADRYLQDILTTRAGHWKSVWYLKQFTQDRALGMDPAVVDYGFGNCRDDSETRQLRRVYKAFFETHNGDPLALHEAAMKGDIHGFLSITVKGLRDLKFRRLMKNTYPLPEF